MAAVIISSVMVIDSVEFHILIISQWPCVSIRPIDRRINTSPTRLVRAVIIPAASDFGFW